MKLSVTAENPIERVILALGLAPVTLLDTHVSFIRARAIMVATKLGVFEALRAGPATADGVAAICDTSAGPTGKLLNALVACGYLRHRGGQYRLSALARKWLTSDSPQSIRDKILFEFLEWDFVEHCEAFVRSGTPVSLHASDAPHWKPYQRAMRALAGLTAPEIVRLTPVPPGAATMLDVGGSHGFISVAMCRRHPGLQAVVLDLPAAVDEAAPLLAQEQMGDRVRHWRGDVLREDLGERRWDFIYVSQLLHHFDELTNRQLCERVARALKPGGLLAILELVRPASPSSGSQVGALLDLYFALTSRAGTWSVPEIVGWLREAGLEPGRSFRLRTMPGVIELTASRSR
jgi:SAM-dependent methyltransferase